MSAFLHELVQVGIYKRNQGRIARQVTFAALAVIVVLGCWRMSLALRTAGLANHLVAVEFWFPGMLLLAGGWMAYRLVNLPSFADFLIAVEAEMNKVSWPSRPELIRASLVVLVTIFFLAAVLFGFDWFWRAVFKLLGIL